jgi:hypothetical protein
MTGYLSPSDVDSVGDDDISSILGLGANASQQKRLMLQMELANRLRGNEPSKGQIVPQGSTFLPASPLTTAMQTFDHLQGIVSSMQGEKQGEQLDNKHQQGLMKFAKLLFKQNQQPQQNPAQADPSSVDPLDPSQQQ